MLKIKQHCEAFDEFPEKTLEVTFDEDSTWEELVCAFIGLLPTFGYIIDYKILDQMQAAIHQVAYDKLEGQSFDPE